MLAHLIAEALHLFLLEVSFVFNFDFHSEDQIQGFVSAWLVLLTQPTSNSKDLSYKGLTN